MRFCFLGGSLGSQTETERGEDAPGRGSAPLVRQPADRITALRVTGSEGCTKVREIFGRFVPRGEEAHGLREIRRSNRHLI